MRYMMSSRISHTFHQTFALNIPALVQILDVVRSLDKNGSTITNQILTERTNLGPNYIKAMPQYCIGTGLLNNNRSPTSFGRKVLEFDEGLSKNQTLWLMHYYMSCPQGPGPELWHHLVTENFRLGTEISKNSIQQSISDFLQTKGKKAADRTIVATARIFWGSYTKDDAFGPLGILRETNSDRFLVDEPDSPQLWIFAYALADYWTANWGDCTGVNITKVAERGGLGTIFLMGGGMINKYLGILQSKGYAVVQRRTPPFQLNRNWKSKNEFIKKIYDDTSRISE